MACGKLRAAFRLSNDSDDAVLDRLCTLGLALDAPDRHQESFLGKTLPYEWLVGLRYTRAGRRSGRNQFLSFISLISVSGIALGVASLIIVLSIMNGFQKDVRDRMLSVLSHIEVSGQEGSLPDWERTADRVLRHPDVVGAAPFVAAEAMLTRGQLMQGAMVRGILPEQDPQVSNVDEQVHLGSLADLQSGTFRVLLGSLLAQELGARVGDQVTLMAPQGQITPAGVIPRMRQFTVAGILNTGHDVHDAALAFIHMEDAIRMFRTGAPTGLRLRVSDIYAAPEVANELRGTLDGNVLVQDWSQQNQAWFAAVQTEKRMMSIILTIIILVAVFNVVSTLVMTVTDKQADIAILRTVGASPRSIMMIFLIQGGLIGLIGTAIGVAGGVLVSLNMDAIAPFIERLLGIEFLPSNIYLINTLPSDLRWSDVGFVGGLAAVLGLVLTLYPSWTAAKVKPAEALRYE
jgi:lipoprotein-releasing system permease protein